MNDGPFYIILITIIIGLISVIWYQYRMKQRLHDKLGRISDKLWLMKAQQNIKHQNKYALNNPNNCVKLLVICSDTNEENHYELWRNKRLKNGKEIMVEQASYNNISLTTYVETSGNYERNAYPTVSLKRAKFPVEGSTQNRTRMYQPDMLLIRDCLRGTRNKAVSDLNVFYGFWMSQIPCINSFKSIWMESERAIITSELIKLNRKFGQNKFPIIKTYYYDSWKQMNWKDAGLFYNDIITNDDDIMEDNDDDDTKLDNNIPDSYPFVLKIGNCHAGFMKLLVHDNDNLNDVKRILGDLDKDYYIHAQKFIEGIGDLRIQKIGNNYRVFKRISVSGDWKTNTGTPWVDEIKLESKHKFWVDQCSKCFNMDICCVDVLLSKHDNKEYILEFGGTASGFGDKKTDNITLVDMVLDKMNAIFV